MKRNQIIAALLLSLLLAANWHNSVLHSHVGENQLPAHAAAHSHDHGAHSHDGEVSSLWDLLHHLFGNLQHPDLGDSHLELFLRPSGPGGHSLAPSFDLPPLAFVALNQALSAPTHVLQRFTPKWVLSFSDPPFLDALAGRGPPSFS